MRQTVAFLTSLCFVAPTWARIRGSGFQGSSLSAARKEQQLESKEADPFKRVWFLCKSSAFQEESAEEEALGIQVDNEMNCTAQMTMKELCCAPWKTGLNFNHSVLGNLQGSQSTVGTTALGSSNHIVKLCTQAVDGEALMEEHHETAATMPVECVNQNFGEDDLHGGGEMRPGEIFLRARILFFIQQGISAENIPTCSKEVETCNTGEEPTTVDPNWVDLQNGASLLSLYARADSHARQKAFAGALMTSGSFTLMAWGADD